MFPLKEHIIEISEKIDKPLLCINTEAFQNPVNMEAMKHLEADSSVFVTIKYVVINYLFILLDRY